MDTKHLVAIGADHGGFPLKQQLVEWLNAKGFRVLDLGAYENDPDDDFPDYAQAVAQAIKFALQQDHGVAINEVVIRPTAQDL